MSVFKEFSEDGNQYSYSLNTVEDGVLQDHEVVVSVKMCALSRESKSEMWTQYLSKSPKCQIAASNSFAGVVTEVGALVSRCEVGDRIAGILPYDSEHSACSRKCVISEFDLIKLPDAVDYESAACCIEDGLRAYLALHYHGRLSSGDTVLIMDAATAFGCLTIQLAHLWNAKVLAVVSKNEDRSGIQKLQHLPEHVIELDSKTTSATTLYSNVMEETGRLGVDVLIDNGLKPNAIDIGHKNTLLLQHDIISCLAVGGRWVTSCSQLQLDPPNSQQLFLRGASVNFLCVPSWNLSSVRQGKLLHILEEVVHKVANGHLRPHISQTIKFTDSLDVFKTINTNTLGTVLVEIG